MFVHLFIMVIELILFLHDAFIIRSTSLDYLYYFGLVMHP